MKILYHGKDGGYESTVFGFWLFEFKRLCSLVLLRFENGSREAYHSHAFSCFSWVLRGKLIENHLNGTTEIHKPSWRPFVTRRSTFHKVVSEGRTWVLSVRGPWAKTWEEQVEDKRILLGDGRRVLMSKRVHRIAK